MISHRFLNTFPAPEMLRHPYLMAERPFRIWGNLYFVGNSWCSSHLIDTGDGLILLDTGCLAELPYLLDNIWSVGFDPREIKIILISHAHHDHYGAANALQRITGAQVYIGAVDAADMAARPEWFKQHNMERIPEEENFKADYLLEDGDIISMGNTKIECVLTPGHTPGVMSHFWTAYERDGRAAKVGIYGGSGFSTVRTEFLKAAGLPLSLQSEFLRSIDKVYDRKVDLMLGNHPCHNDTFAKARRIQAGDSDAFLDSSLWQTFLDELKNSCVEFFKLTKEEQAPLYSQSYFADYCGDNAAKYFKVAASIR